VDKYNKGVGSGSVSQRCGSGSAPKCHGSATLVPDPWRFDTDLDLDPLVLRIWILLFSSMTSKMPTKLCLFPSIFCLLSNVPKVRYLYKKKLHQTYKIRSYWEVTKPQKSRFLNFVGWLMDWSGSGSLLLGIMEICLCWDWSSVCWQLAI
jgi:hypothetical protein